MHVSIRLADPGRWQAGAPVASPGVVAAA